ncbi:MAG: hypothetical protein U0792_06870 [Gemmataceae bacterium]
MRTKQPRASSTQSDSAKRKAARIEAAKLKAEKAIRNFLAHGRRSLKHLDNLPDERQHFHKAENEKQADDLGWSETKLRKARLFAKQYPREEDLDDLCREIRKHRGVFGTAHIGILVTVPDADVRKSLLRWCIDGSYSKTELELEVQKLYGKKVNRGRSRRVVKDRGRLLLQVEEMADTWIRWHRQVEAKSFLSTLPENVRDKVAALTPRMKSLHQLALAEVKLNCEKELKAKRKTARTTK